MKRTVFTSVFSMLFLLIAVLFVSAEGEKENPGNRDQGNGMMGGNRFSDGLGDHADKFYGYYTIHTVKDGKVEGMLSVNGYTGDVWYHSWHGSIIQMEEGDDNNS